LKKSLKILLNEIVDYAGLFPPAALDMIPAQRNFRDYRDSEHAWMLGRFIVPVADLDEFELGAVEVLPSIDKDDPWMVSAITGPDLAKDLDKILAFNYRFSAGGKQRSAVIDTLELKATDPRSIEESARMAFGSFTSFYEIPIDRDPSVLVQAIATAGAGAKVRTGGVTDDKFPPVGDLLRFMRACKRADVPFKATAGLHHPCRGTHPLTDEVNSPEARMHGFLNLFLTAACVYNGLPKTCATDLMGEGATDGIEFDDEGVTWSSYRLTNDQLFASRRRFATSFGSCSFEEPIADLKGLGLL
jgi:hypothetical protein